MVTQPAQCRQVDTPFGAVTYQLTCKRVLRLNLRVKEDGSVRLSVPLGCSEERADHFVREKAEWIADVRARLARERVCELPDLPDEETCRLMLSRSLARVYPLAAAMGVDMPLLKLRAMKSQWGNCHWRQGYITLNTALARCPEELQDYVALHELVHFLHQNHGPEFYGTMDRLMPDWQERRRRLKGFGAALDMGSGEKKRNGS